MPWLILIPILFIIYIFLIAPDMRRREGFSSVEGKIICHRGLHTDGVPENSLPAFKKAVDIKCPIELDIRLTKDNKIAVFHDGDLKRMCGLSGRPEDMTLSELKALKLSGTDYTVPSLEEVLSIVNGAVPLIIEYKVSGNNGKMLCLEADKVLNTYKGQYFVQSFYPEVLYWFRKNRPEILRGQLTSATAVTGVKGFLIATLLVNVKSRPDFISCSHKTVGFSRFINKILGAKIIGWTFKSEDSIRKNGARFYAYIGDNICPDVLKKV